MFHDDGRFFAAKPQRPKPPVMTLFTTKSTDGGLTWSVPQSIFAGSEIHLCEPGCVRSPDGKQLAVLLRENARRKNSHIIFSNDEGATWTAPRELPLSLTGDRHTCRYGPDGRLVITFRDRTPGKNSPTEGDWVAWVGRYADLVAGREGQYRLRMMDNTKGWDTCYPGLELLPCGTFVATTYGHWEAGHAPYIVSVRFQLEEIDKKAAAHRANAG
jgi:hypothetical protein